MSKSYMGWLREHVGHQKIFLIGASALIRDARGRVLLQQRRDVGVWSIPGGAQELGESIVDTTRREVFEEMGLQVEPTRVVGLYTSPRLDVKYPNGDQTQIVVPCFECEITGGELKMQESEVLAAGWYDQANLPPLTPFAQVALRDAKKFRGEAFFEIADSVIASGAKQSPSRSLGIASAQKPHLATTNYVAWLRQYVGHAKIILPGAAGMVRDAQGRVLLQRRRDNGLWGFPGGLIELGESATDAIVREFREEVGLQIEPKRLVGVYTSPDFDRSYPNGDQSQLFASFFECEVICGELQMQEEEVLELGWFDLNNLPPMIACCAAKARDARIFKGAAFWR